MSKYNCKVKLIVGFRRDQEHSIPADEAHKAYYLFLNPDSRGVFSNGLAIKGSQIEEIVPDYIGIMEWNPTHVMDSDDWNEIRDLGIDRHMTTMISAAKDIARLKDPKDLETPLTELIQKKYPQLERPSMEIRQGEKSMKQLLEGKKI